MTTLTPEELNKIREIRIHSILGLVDNGRKISMRCPLPNHDDKTPSFTLYPDNSWCCFGKCDKTGQGAIDFCIALDYTFIEACEELVKYL